MKVIDFHTHAFPDSLAERAVGRIVAEADDVAAFTDGTVRGLLASMDRNGIERSVICNIATKPSQFQPIFEWSEQIQSERLIVLPSVHPADEKCAEQVEMIGKAGFKGIKLHPFYQDFVIDEERLLPIYEQCCKYGLMVVMHCGYDIAFARERRGEPAKILNVVERFPELKFIATHLGGWEIWDEVEELMTGKNIYLEISYSLEYLDKETATRLIVNHPREYVLFGSDSPWQDQSKAIELLSSLDIEPQYRKDIFYNNAVNILGG